MTADATIVDPGTLDTETCSIDWGDGTTNTLFVGTLRECQAPHTYAAAGSYTVAVTVTDKDGGTGTDSKTLVVNAPPDVHVGDTGGNEGSAIPLIGDGNRPGERPAPVHVDGDSAVGRRPRRRLHDLRTRRR